MSYNIETDESGSMLYVHNEKENHHIVIKHITYVKVLEMSVQVSLTTSPNMVGKEIAARPNPRSLTLNWGRGKRLVSTL